jgi:hypothetical protein
MACILRIFCILFCISDHPILMRINMHIIVHILHIIIDAYCGIIVPIVHIVYIHCTMYIVHIVHVLDAKVILRVFIVYCHYCLVPQLRPSLRAQLSCLRTTAYNHHHCLLIYHRKLLESQLLPDARRRVFSYLKHFFLEIYHIFLEILRTFTGIFLLVLRSEYSFSDGGAFLSQKCSYGFLKIRSFGGIESPEGLKIVPDILTQFFSKSEF